MKQSDGRKDKKQKPPQPEGEGGEDCLIQKAEEKSGF